MQFGRKYRNLNCDFSTGFAKFLLINLICELKLLQKLTTLSTFKSQN